MGLAVRASRTVFARARIVSLRSTPVALLALWGMAPGLAAQTIRGRVSDAATGRVIGSVAVALVDASGSVVVRAASDDSGQFTLAPGAPGTYRVRFAAPGYRTAESHDVALTGEQTAQVSALLEPLTALELDTVMVEGRRVPRYLEGYERRSHFGWGTFFSTERIERSRSRKFTDLTPHFPGFIIKYDQLGHRTISNDKRTLHQGACPPLVYVDGSLVGDASNYDLDTIKVDWIAAIEVYNSQAFTPLEFNTFDATCGVIVIWLKRGRG